MYVLLAGLPGTGKSTLAAALARRLSGLRLEAVILNKDDVRAALFPGVATDYSEEQNDLCFEAMLAAAGYLRGKSTSFIFFDGRTFSNAAQIEPVIAAAEAGGSRWCILHLICPDEVIERRLTTSAATHPAANRTFALYLDLQTRFEAIQRSHLTIDASQPLQDCVEAALAYIDLAKSVTG